MKSHGITWNHMESHEISWNNTESHKNHMESHGITWNHTESHEITWNQMKSGVCFQMSKQISRRGMILLGCLALACCFLLCFRPWDPWAEVWIPNRFHSGMPMPWQSALFETSSESTRVHESWWELMRVQWRAGLRLGCVSISWSSLGNTRFDALWKASWNGFASNVFVPRWILRCLLRLSNQQRLMMMYLRCIVQPVWKIDT